MSKDAIAFVAGSSGASAIVTWLSVFLYFILVGADAMLMRMITVGIVLSVTYSYFSNKESKGKK